MKYEHDPRLPWRNPENVPLDKIPDGWRLMLPGDEGDPKNRCRIWLDESSRFGSSQGCSGGESEYTYVIPSTVPLPEEFREPEAKPVVTVDNSELRDQIALAVLPIVYKSLHEACHNGSPWTKNWQLGISLEAYDIADAMLKAREFKP